MIFHKMALPLIAVAVGLGASINCDAKPKTIQKPKVQNIASAPAPDWMENAVIYEANLRQGTTERNLKGLQKQLPRLKDLGVDIIWLMPIHPISEKNRKGDLGSYYAVKNYKEVNPEFGTLQDLKEFVQTAHLNGMKVILDEVCNHTGADNAWVTEHPEYYAKDKDGNMISPFDWTDVYQLDYSNPATREAMTDALKFWVEEADIDGYRCDVAGMVPVDYWEEAVPQLRAIKPIFMLAEASEPPLLLNAFNADYAWPMKDTFDAIAFTQGVNQYAKDHDKKYDRTTGTDIFKLINQQKTTFPQGAVHMNMVTNHDLNSWEGTEFERYGEGLAAFAVLSYTLPGMPMMYTGQEVGFNHPFEFFVQDPVMPNYSSNQMTTFYEMLNSLKHNHPALNVSSPMTELSTTSDDIVAFTRQSGDDNVIVIANLSGSENPLSFRDGAPKTDGMVDYFIQAPAVLPATLAPWQTIVFVTPN